jgi:histidinol-phosphate aminotransferase
MHEDDRTFDLKRGELYPEILRANISLKRTLAGIYGIDPAQAQPNFGSNGSIDTIITAVKIREAERGVGRAGSEGSGLMVPTPTYFRNYNSAEARKLFMHKVPLDKDYSFDAQRFVEEMRRVRPSVVFLVTPNNPTGMPLGDAAITAVLDSLPGDTWAVMDRTLVNVRPEISTKELLQRYSSKNLVILHSFSKFARMSQQRIGYALYSNPEMAEIVRPCLPLGMNLEATTKANCILLRDKGLYPSPEVVQNIKENRVLLDGFTAGFPKFRITDFAANYCMLLLPDGLTSETVSSALEAKGLYVMPGHSAPEPDNRSVRLYTAGPAKYMKMLLDEVTETFGAHA